MAAVEPAPRVRFVCGLCGGVRVPNDDASVTPSPAQIALLKKVTVARSASTTWGIVAAAVGAFGVGSVLVLALVISVAQPAATATVVAGLAAAVPLVFAALAFARSRRHAREMEPLLESAWIAAAADLARARGGEIDARTLARMTRIGESDADHLLGRMSAQSLLVSSVTPEGGLAYTLVEAPLQERALPAAE
jgi:hypothetical protein